MEVGSRLPAGNGMDAVVWFLGHKWQAGSNAAPPTAAPCYYQESDTAVTLAWFGGEGEEVTSFFGTVGPEAVLPDELELCKRALAEGAGEADAAAGTEADDTARAAVDFSVPPEEAVAIIEAGSHTIVDVRTPAEYEAAHVIGAVNIDVEAPDFAERIAELDPDGSYLLYCRTGRRSDLAAQQMAAAGFTDIVDAAGLADLARAGAPIE